MWKSIPYEEKYLEELIELIKENYGDVDIADPLFLQHQYFKNPSGDAVISLAVDTDGTLAGQYSVCPVRVKAFDEEASCTLSLNTLTKASHRGQGIFTKLAEETYDQIKNTALFCYGMPNQNSYKGFLTKLNFKEIGVLSLFLKPLKPSKMVREYLHSKFLSRLALPMDLIFKLRGLRNPSQEYKIIEVTEENLDLMDRFWAGVKSKYPVIFVRDSKFIRWRYLELPLREYSLYTVLHRGDPVAFSAGRIIEVSNMNCGMLADFLVMPGAEAAGKMLLEFLGKKFSDNGASLMGGLMRKSAQEAAIMKNSGFYLCPKAFEPQPFPLIVRLFDEKLQQTEIMDFNQWFFTMGDYDVV